MTGQITRIHPQKKSRDGKATFIRLEFKLEDGTWAKTDLCMQFRNFERWIRFLNEPGTVLENLHLRAPGCVDADSKPNPSPVKPSEWQPRRKSHAGPDEEQLLLL